MDMSENKMSENEIIEYMVDSAQYSSTIRHELLFSIKRRNFLKPSYSKKSQGKLVYLIYPGNYLKFELFASRRQNYAHLSILLIHIDKNGIDSKELVDAKMPYSMIFDIQDDINAPYALKEFLRMIPRYHQTANVDINENYEMAEDAMTMVESIKLYLESKLISQ